MKYKDLSGLWFGALHVIKPSEILNGFYDCKCSCGKEINVDYLSLTKGYTRSCGCLKRYNTKHNLVNTKLYNVWTDIRQRCLNIKNPNYKNYGGRGITICKSWAIDFKNFYDWALANGYKEGLTIDRIDVNGNYEPSNCRWATMKEQSRNKRNNVFLTFNGETHCVADWIEKLNISKTTFNYRRKRYLAGLMTEKELFKIKE